MVGAGVKEILFAALKAPRHCSLVLLIGVRLVFEINSILILILMKLEGLHWGEIRSNIRSATVEQNFLMLF
jgi:hypothetical protein